MSLDFVLIFLQHAVVRSYNPALQQALSCRSMHRHFGGHGLKPKKKKKKSSLLPHLNLLRGWGGVAFN